MSSSIAAGDLAVRARRAAIGSVLGTGSVADAGQGGWRVADSVGLPMWRLVEVAVSR
ncbi:hypothetical protein ACFYXF_01020 [Streptomyces sp. NPDC002680]|uniref:hypothetical protein n=1 Tax=Streptomyces sp. NPDC002680 TaxID=3364659 RepID=UPI003696BC4B